MNAALERALGRVWHSSLPRAVLDDLTARDRFTGTAGERRTADALVDHLDGAGATGVHRETVPITVWTGEGATLSIDSAAEGPGDRTLDAIALPYSPAGTVSGPVRSIEATAGDLDGAIALARTGGDTHRLEAVGRAADAGAAGFLLAHDRPGQLRPTGTIGTGETGPIVAAGISHETAARLERARSVDLSVEAHTGEGHTHLVRGRVGPDTDERVLVLAHHDAHSIGEGALDNAAGVAALSAIVEVLAAVDLPVGIEVATVGGEEIGLLGSDALAADLDTDRIRAVVNCDGIGRHPRPKAITHGSSALAEVIAATADALDRPIDREPRVHPYSDHWPFLRRGVPALQFHSERTGPTAGEWDRGWTHTAADTREKVSIATVRDHAMVAAVAILRVLDADLPRRSPATIRETFETTGMADRMRTAGVWPEEW